MRGFVSPLQKRIFSEKNIVFVAWGSLQTVLAWQPTQMLSVHQTFKSPGRSHGNWPEIGGLWKEMLGDFLGTLWVLKCKKWRKTFWCLSLRSFYAFTSALWLAASVIWPPQVSFFFQTLPSAFIFGFLDLLPRRSIQKHISKRPLTKLPFFPEIAIIAPQFLNVAIFDHFSHISMGKCLFGTEKKYKKKNL